MGGGLIFCSLVGFFYYWLIKEKVGGYIGLNLINDYNLEGFYLIDV